MSNSRFAERNPQRASPPPIPTPGSPSIASWRSGASVWRNETTGDFAASAQGAGWKQIARPRIGLYKSWMPVMDEGWTRWLFEQFGFEYTSLRNADVAAGNLRRSIST